MCIAAFGGLLLGSLGCESQPATEMETEAVSTKRFGVVSEFVSEGVRRYEAELNMGAAGGPADEDGLLARELEPVDEDAGAPDPAERESTLSDDGVRCGDGRISDGELCDVAIAAGEPGACPTHCEPSEDCEEPVLIVRTCWSRCAAEDSTEAPDCSAP